MKRRVRRRTGSAGPKRRGDSRKREPKRPRLLNRLIGLETEYAPVFVDGALIANEDIPTARVVYQAIVDIIRHDQPTAVGVYDQDQVFLASGGAISFESHPSVQSQPGGLVEIATPEVRSVSDLIACQRAMDELVAEAASRANLNAEVRVLKNSSDSVGHVYGCQENYEAVVARGLWLVVYRAFVLLLWAIQCVSFLIAIPVLAVAAISSFLIRSISRNSEPESTEQSDIFSSMPAWMLGWMIRTLRLIHLPSVMVLRFVGNHVAFRPQRKYLTALLVSRIALTSTGELDADGRFRLSAKAMFVDRVADIGGFNGERPIFVYGHWLSQLCAKSFFSLASAKALMARKQRLQIGLSDSNLCDLAEYVKVGSVALVLDMIERGNTNGLPKLRRPLWSLNRINCDWNLVSRVPTSHGELSAIEIQRIYHREASRFVASVDSSDRGEALDVLRHWRGAVDLIAKFRQDASALEPALGRIDWMSKLWMLNQLDHNVAWTVRKKVCLRYHELSSDGYHHKLAATMPEARIVSDEQIEKRRISPPSNSPAARRGWLIREFAGLDTQLRAEWSHATVADGSKQRRIEFSSTGS